ncbi:hypothetical protein MMIN_01160 [Mycolicibacter minnesotensis]|nr:hypothetical protein MMIN_01160 [Mycolicibacter minnesotensis]
MGVYRGCAREHVGLRFNGGDAAAAPPVPSTMLRPWCGDKPYSPSIRWLVDDSVRLGPMLGFQFGNLGPDPPAQR